ncbi:hypothetical protein AB0I69_02455 [Streptomyces sp. NPDC050508]
MAEATAMANPLSVPVAVAGSLVYALAPTAPPAQGSSVTSSCSWSSWS